MSPQSEIKNIEFKRILVANRGEIACRLIQSIQELGKEAIAIFSEADANARHCALADEAIAIGGISPRDSYLVVDKIIAAAKASGADAVHPGYGFLSERADAAQAFIQAGIAWIGPSPESIHKLGNKIEAKKLLDSAQVPTLPWCQIDASDSAALKIAATKIGFPLLLKAAAGGGGKGMRLVIADKDLEEAAAGAAREGLSAFGDGTIFMERYLENPKHIEVQILGDHFGEAMHLGERDCSSQRRHQKVIEEAPSGLSLKARTAITSAAVALAKSVGYANAGTAEFLVDNQENFFFLEMNSRLQVEHTVSEMVWGVDLVRAQILVAEGKKLSEIFPAAAMPAPRGHAIQARLYAEDAANGFLPCPGSLPLVEWPKGLHVRIDTGVESGSEITMNYDPMIAKITVWGEDRECAIARLQWALRNTLLLGTTTNINYLQDILDTPTFRKRQMHVKYLEKSFAPWQNAAPQDLLDNLELVKSLVNSKGLARSGPSHEAGARTIPSPWEAK